MNPLKVRLKTERLLLVPINKKYSKSIFKEFNKEVTKYMYPSPLKTIKAAEEWINSSTNKMKKGEELVTVILKRSNKEFLGVAAIHQINTQILELGVWLKLKAHGKGYGQESMKKIKEWTDRHIDYNYIKYPVDMRNKSSKKIPASMGGKVKKESKEKNMSGKMLYLKEYRIYKK
jgi:[ribosomal protein S5]-alanine N-acetyltransferase